MRELNKIIKTLRDKKLTLSTAESCSAGYLSYLLTKIPGSSQIFKGGIIVYSLESKQKLLKIPPSLLKQSQGVSKEITLLLAKNIRKLFNTSIGAAITGFAGPGAKKGQKCGTVFIAIADKNSSQARKIIIKGNRDYVRKKSSELLIKSLYKKLNPL